MKNTYYRLPFKATAVILATLVGLLTILFALSGVVMEMNGFYTRSEAALRKDAFRTLLAEQNSNMFYDLIVAEATVAAVEYPGNYYYQIFDPQGEVVAANYDGQPVQMSLESVYDREIYVPGGDFYQEERYIVVGYLAAEFAEIDSFSVAEDWIGFFYRYRYSVFLWAALGLLAEVALIIYLFCSAGNHPDEDVPRLNPMDRIPFDVVTVAVFAVALLEIYFLDMLNEPELYLYLLFCGIVDFLLALWYFLSLATRLKVGGVLRNTLIGKCLIWVKNGIKVLLIWLRRLFSQLPLIWKTSLALVGISFAEFMFLLMVWEKGTLLLWWLAEKLLLVPLVLWVAVSLRKIQKGGERLAAGNLEEWLETDDLFGDFKRFGESLNSIGDGMNKAVEERMKSERFKTELITNVSHDIKTPLTSMINYVDLIKKEEPENQRIREYIGVLDRQSARLKKLIEDLVEASKASSGSLPIHPEPCDAAVLLTQMAGEYDERLREKELEPVLRLPEQPAMISADPRHLWRILDNLMVNIVKYAQSGTRVYLDLSADDQETTIRFRNISRAPLNISGEELLERFVRGDSSRNTEGSGLGLSIARSLAELQGGRLVIEVDGDLFKVTLRFPRLH